MRKLAFFAWGLSALVVILGFIAWGQGIRWQFSALSTYKLFPLFGLTAFSLMWSLYVLGFIRRRLTLDATGLDDYYKFMPLAIFFFIMLHPGLLIWQLWRDGFGLPPTSYLQNYVAPSLRWAALIGTTALLVFIVYEFRYKFRDKKWWKYIEVLADLFLAALFFHALGLGSQLQSGWYRYVWFIYGAILLVVLADLYRFKLKNRAPKQN